jgi:transcriptional regulator with XRE-family HTH domain
VLLAMNLRRLRAQRGMSQEALADRAGIHRTYLGSVERGQRNIAIDNICRLASALEVDVRELLGPVRGPVKIPRYAGGARRGPTLKVSEGIPSRARRGRRRPPTA